MVLILQSIFEEQCAILGTLIVAIKSIDGNREDCRSVDLIKITLNDMQGANAQSLTGAEGGGSATSKIQALLNEPPFDLL